MDGERFDRIVRVLGAGVGRRGLVRGAVGAALGTALGLPSPGGAQGWDCTLKANGRRCATGTECCSGRCVRKRGTTKKFCRKAPFQGICAVRLGCDHLAQCDRGGFPPCICTVTSRGHSFCAQFPVRCADCDSDADCEVDGDWRYVCLQGCSDCSDTGGRACGDPCLEPATA